MVTLAAFDLVGEVASFVLGGVLGAGSKTLRRLVERTPLRRLFGPLADSDQEVSIFMRDMVSVDGKYYSWQPDAAPVYWRGFSVVAQPDVQVAGDVVNLLGRVGRTGGFVWRNLERDFDLWTQPVICVGGSPKADRILAACDPKLVSFEFPDRFVTVDQSVFQMTPAVDYGVIYKGRHPQTGAVCLLLYGFGVLGTQATGTYLLRHAHELATIYGPHSFAVIVAADPTQGRDSARAVWLSSTVDWNSLLAHPFTAWKHRRLLKRRPHG